MSKYGNHKVKAGGHTFDSQAEYNRYCELKLLERAGDVSQLEVHPMYELLPAYTIVIDGKKRKRRAITYEADFAYVENGIEVIEDVKGAETAVFKLKRKMFEYKYGKSITIVRAR